MIKKTLSTNYSEVDESLKFFFSSVIREFYIPPPLVWGIYNYL